MTNFTPQKIVVSIIIALFFFLGTVAFVYWLVFKGSLIGFVSTNSRYKWEIDRNGLQEIEDVYRVNGLNNLVLVEFSGKFKYIEDYATGWDPDDGPVYYSEWGEKIGIPTLKIYMDEEKFLRVPEDSKSLLITLLVMQRIEQKISVSEEKGELLAGNVYADKVNAPLGIIKRIIFK